MDHKRNVKYSSSAEDIEKFVFSKPGHMPTNYVRLFMQVAIAVCILAGIYFFFTSKTNLLDYLTNSKKSINTTIDQVESLYKEDAKGTKEYYLNKEITILGRYTGTEPDGSVFYIGSYGGDTKIFDAEIHVSNKKDIQKIPNFGLGTAVKVKGKITHLDDKALIIKAESFEREIV